MIDATPTLRSELRRGFNLYNLGVALGAAFVLASSVYVLTAAGWIPLIAATPWRQSLVSGLALFALITLLHAATHAYFGWRFERGAAALSRGDAATAVRLLRIAERRGIEHYDEHGAIRRLLQSIREGRITS